MANSALYNKIFGSGLQGGAKKSANFFKLLFDKRYFLVKTFFTLFVQLVITYLVMMNYVVDDKTDIMYFYIILVAQFTLIFILVFIPMHTGLKFCVFSAFSAIAGVLCAYVKKNVGEDIVNMAITGAASIFAFMAAFGAFLIFSGVKLGLRFGSFLFSALLLLIIMRIVTLFSGSYNQYSYGFAVLGLILFSIYIIYDTNQILQREYYGDFITASLDYYLDIINIFLKLTRIFSDSDSNSN